VANKAIVVFFLSAVIWWQFWQPIPTAVWMNLPSFFSGWQVKHVSGLMSFGSMKGCSISSSAQTPKGDRRQMTKSVVPPFRACPERNEGAARAGLKPPATSLADLLAEANGGASSVKNLRVPTAQQKCLHC
jgi:hypothetical protein